MNIGPRICYISSGEGRDSETIKISIECQSRGSPFPNDPMGYEGFVVLKSDRRDETFRLYATDEILMVGRLVKLVGSYLLGVCEREGMKLSTDERPEVKTPFDLF